MEGSIGNDDSQRPREARDAELPLSDMRNWQLIPSANESPVKSTAVVKYSAVPRAASFAQLQCNTDLNLPPSNWLSSAAESYGLQHVRTHSTGFSSFRLAHMFPDCVGQVDVVSDAENIKKLLKIPYSQGAVSMIVHRIENTLLIDDFDVHKLLLQQSKSDWEWLKEFLLSNVLQSMSMRSMKDKGLVPSHGRSALQNRLLVSKFLHHSLAATNPPPPPPPLLKPVKPASQLPLFAQEPPLPEPQVTEQLPGSGSNHKFLRNVVWNFEDLQMLLGTDMPIFGGANHPCISLRLCDMAKPISVLTGIDYWLDNLMSNVPEVVMCFHLDGIVKRYELVKTEDLPVHFNDSKFSPKVIRDVAQNILSFLKINAAKAGHTYWLFKGKDDDYVKLYDLSSLCTDSVDEKGQNPFTVPVAMLLYRVARNMKHSVDGQHKRSTIAVLLENCVRLLDAQKYPQIVTSAHYMLSDLFIPATIDPAKPVFDDELDEEEKEKGNQNLVYTSTNSLFKKKSPTVGESCHEQSQHGSLIHSSDSDSEQLNATEPERKHVFTNYPRNSLTSVKSLNFLTCECDPKRETDDDEASKFSQPPPLASTVPERCVLSLKHIAVGLQCLQYFGHSKEDNTRSRERMTEEEEAPQLARPFEPIPMPYSPLNKNDNMEEIDKQLKNKKNNKKTAKIGAHDERSSKNVPGGIKNLLCPVPAGCMPTWQTPDANDNVSWNTHLKTLLYEKACLVYATLAESAYASERYGRAVQMVGRVLRCRVALGRLMGAANPSRPKRGDLESYLLGRAGDCCVMLLQDWPHIDSHRRDLVSNTGVDAEIEHEMFRDCRELDSVELSLMPEKLESMEQMLKTGLACYERGLELSPQLLNFHRRIGNVHNELGCLYMSQVQAKFDENMKNMHLNYEVMDPLDRSSFRSKLDLSLAHLEAGLRSFEAVQDKANLALLHFKKGRLLRLCAYFNADPKEQFFPERSFYDRSLISYESALANLGQRKGHEDIWDAVVCELSTALYNMALLAMESLGPQYQTPKDAEKMAFEYFHRALKYCDAESPGTRQPVYQYRAASIHGRLASLYQQSYRKTWNTDERHARVVLQSSRLHYDKCCEAFSSLKRTLEYFTAHLERIDLEEFFAKNFSQAHGKYILTNRLVMRFFLFRPMLSHIVSRSDTREAGGDTSVHSQEKTKVDEEDDRRELSLLTLLEERLRMTLRLAYKHSIQCRQKEMRSLAPCYLYLCNKSLRFERPPEKPRDAVTFLAKHLYKLIGKIQCASERFLK